MRYTKRALLTFGSGLVLGLIVVVLGWDPIGRVAAGLMALGIVAIPIALIADWRAKTRPAPPPARRRATVPPRRATRSKNASVKAPRRRPRKRKPAAPKR
jgi:hypothetical protein